MIIPKRGNVMLTIRLKQNGVLNAMQTNCAVTLLKFNDEAYASVPQLIPTD
jgi:exosome complex RNA-binding protein Csl4